MTRKYLEKEFYLDTIDETWRPFFQSEAQKEYFPNLLAKIDQEYQNYQCWPQKANIFRLFREIPVEKIKVVILGQDPYHLPGVADGLAFSTQKEKYIPASLRNIFLEFSHDLNCTQPTKGDLLPWVKEGVLLINTALTVREGQALSHMSWWKEFTHSLMTYLKNYAEKLIWVFWGQKAKEIGEECEISKSYSLFSTHPSPYSAKGKDKNQKGYFIGSRVFSEINRSLLELKKEPINWLTILNLPCE